MIDSQSDALTMRFGTPRRGWLDVMLTGPDGTAQFAASHLVDSLATLVEAGIDLVEGREPREVRWFIEPKDVVWRFRDDGERFDLVTREDRGDPVVPGGGSREAIGLLIWSALRRLQADPAWAADATCWRHPFPDSALAILGARLERRAR